MSSSDEGESGEDADGLGTITEITEDSHSIDSADDINQTDKKIVNMMKDDERQRMNVQGAFVQDSKSSWISDVSRSMNSDSSELNMDVYKVR